MNLGLAFFISVVSAFGVCLHAGLLDRRAGAAAGIEDGGLFCFEGVHTQDAELVAEAGWDGWDT